MELFTRDTFRQKIFERDKSLCVVCGSKAQDAHHIMERRLFDNGGYYMENGVSLCADHHIKAEQTLLSCDELREKAGIDKIVLPEHLYDDCQYDKWCNIILPNGNRLKGELFFDESVQKILESGKVLDLFTSYVKYPRTYHLPWSGKVSSDDRFLSNTSNFANKIVVMTPKYDGENTTMYQDYIHARSLDSRSHPSRDWVKGLHGKISYNIPDNWRICGENLYAKHTIAYNNLKSYFMVFSIWNDKNECLDWDSTLEWCSLLGLEHVPILWAGLWNEDLVKKCYVPTYDGNACEGYVVRLVESFPYKDFRKSVAKYVHEDFRNNINEDRHHWMYKKVVPNRLGEDKSVQSFI